MMIEYLGATLLTAAAQTLSTADQADGKCMAALTSVSEKAGADDKGALDATILFFMGKIVGRSGKAAVGPAIGAGAATLKDEDVGPTAERCAGEVEAASSAM